MATNQAAPHLAKARSAAALPYLACWRSPFPCRLPASLLLPFLATRANSRLWPQTSPIRGHLCAALAVIGLWLPALLAVVSSGHMGSTATTWLSSPLRAPVGASW